MGQLAGRIILLWGWRRYLVALLAGAFAVLAQAPFDFTAACFVSFPTLVWLIDGATGDPARGRLGRLSPAFLIGWWFGFGYFVAGLWWIGNALLVEADAFAWAIPLAVVALPAALAIFYGLACMLARVAWSGDVARIAALALGFGVAEWLRGVVLTGFPWNAIGYAAMPVPVLMQSVSIVGLYGMNAIAVFVFAAPALLGTSNGRGLGLSLAILLVAAHVGFGYARLALADRAGSDRSVSVRLVQPSILQTSKWDASERDRIFATYLDLTRTAPAETGARPVIVVWPETSVPFLFTDRPDALVAIGEALDEGQVLLAGAVRAEGEGGNAATRYYNSVVAISDRGEITAAADKSHLVPFGEYLPMEDLLGSLGLDTVVDTPMSFSAGPPPRPMRLDSGVTVLPLICYEVIFPGETDAAARESDLIVNVTNDAWYGDTPGPYQHFRQAQVRAVEAGRPMVRAANNGVSGAVDAYGRVIDAFALDAVGALDVTVPLARPVLPPPAAPPFIGFAVLAFFAAVILAGRSRQWFKPR